MSDSNPILIPRETVNDDEVTIVRWHVVDGAAVQAGDLLVEIETTKAVMSLEAPSAGTVRLAGREGDRVAVGSAVAFITTAAVSAAPPPPVAPVGAVAAQPAGQDGMGGRFSRQARDLIQTHGLDPVVFDGLPLVKGSDVEAYLQDATTRATTAPPVVTRAIEPESETAPSPAAPAKGFLAEVRVSARDRGWSVFRLGFNYVVRNYLLNLAVRIAPVGLVIVLHRWRGVKIGRGCFIDPTAQIETAYPENITLGDDVRVTAHAVIMTHIKAPHFLREKGWVPLVLKPVRIQDHAFIGVNAVVMPGVTVGEASVVASGAVVLADVPPFTMVAGNPASVIKRFAGTTGRHEIR